MQVELSIIIVNWNSLAYLEKCISTIYSEQGLESFEVIVVDNASYDGSKEYLEQRFPTVQYIQSLSNLGFAKANNLGYSCSRGRYLLFLNPDTEIVAPALGEMVNALRQTVNAAIIGPKLLNSDGSLQTSCVQAFPTILNQILDSELLHKIAPKSRLWGTEALLRQGIKPAIVEMVSGACLMIGREAFEKLGLFATDYFMYAEDLDLCYRASRAGWHVLYLNGAAVFHHGGGSTRNRQSGFTAVLTRESLLIFMKKHYGFPFPLLFKASSFINALIRLLILNIAFLLHVNAHSIVAPLVKWKGVLRWSLGLERWASELSVSSHNRVADN